MPGIERIVLAATAFAGLATLVLALAMLFIYPSTATLSDGFRTPIIAFEFAKSEADLAFLAGSSETATRHRADIDRGQHLDMVFPLAYGGLMALLLVGLARKGVRSAWVGACFALAIIPSDIRENLVMFNITSALDRGQTSADLLPALWSATWIKWWCIAASTGFVAFGSFRRQAWVSGGLAAMAATAIVLTWASNARPDITEAMSLMVAGFFLYFAIQSMVACKRTGLSVTPKR